MTTKQLSRRQVRWSEFLSQFDFIIKSVPGKQNGKLDSLTRRSQDLPDSNSDPRIQFQHQAVFKPYNLDPNITDIEEEPTPKPVIEATKEEDTPHPDQLFQYSVTPPTPSLSATTPLPVNVTTSLPVGTNTPPMDLSPEFSELFANTSWDQEVLLHPAIVDTQEEETISHKLTTFFELGYESDPWWHRVRDELTKPEGIPHLKDISLSECSITDNRLYFRGRLYVPSLSQTTATATATTNPTNLRTFIIQLAHDSVESGHPGRAKLYELIQRSYFWPRLSSDVRQFTRNC